MATYLEEELELSSIFAFDDEPEEDGAEEAGDVDGLGDDDDADDAE